MNVLILGGGISGLSAAWYLHQKNPEAKITLLEKSSRLGGWLDTIPTPFFEKGPRTFPKHRSPHLFSLIQELGLEEELLYSSPKEAKRYLWEGGKLRSLSSYLPQLFIPLLKEPFQPKGTGGDESIYEFAARRLGPKMGATLFEPLILGICGGDFRKLSVQFYFPQMVAWEQEKGSLLRGAFSAPKQEDKRLFTLKRGMKSLVEALQKKLPIQIATQVEVEAIGDGEVIAGGKSWKTDQIFSALPASVLGRVVGLKAPFSSLSLTLVHLSFKEDILTQRGFGYLTSQGENLLGMIWDSSIFPEQQKGKGTRLTVFLRPTLNPIEIALQAVKRHLNSDCTPIWVEVTHAPEAMPQMEVGIGEKVKEWEAAIKKRHPILSLLGNLDGASLEACIARSKRIV